LDGGTELPAGQTDAFLPRSSVTTLEDPPRSVLWDGAILRPDGLLPCQNPNVMTYCPEYYSPHSWVVRALSLSELLRIYQLPLAMDSLFALYLDLLSKTLDRALAQSKISVRVLLLPFENSPSSAILTSIICQLWGDDGGVKVLQPLAEAGDLMDFVESHNRQGGKVLEGGTIKEGELENHTAGIMTVTRPDTPLWDAQVSSRGEELEGGTIKEG